MNVNTETLPDECFPSWLFEPLFNEIEDDYYKILDQKDPITLQARTIRRKYSKFFDWLDAIEIYNEYMEYLIDKYGSLSYIQNAYEVNLLDDYLPPKPKLKNTKKNRIMMQQQEIPSRKISGYRLSDEIIISRARDDIPNEYGDDIDELDSDKKPPKRVRRILKSASDAFAAKSRRKNMFYSSRGSGYDVINDFVTQLTRGSYTEQGEYTEESLTDIIRRIEEERDTPPELYAALHNPEKTIYRGGYIIDRETADQIDIVKSLYSLGIDMIGVATRNMNKSAVKMIKRSVGEMSTGTPMTPKELKKYKKQMKKDAKAVKKRSKQSRELDAILFGNKI